MERKGGGVEGTLKRHAAHVRLLYTLFLFVLVCIYSINVPFRQALYLFFTLSSNRSPSRLARTSSNIHRNDCGAGTLRGATGPFGQGVLKLILPSPFPFVFHIWIRVCEDAVPTSVPLVSGLGPIASCNIYGLEGSAVSNV